MSKVTIIGAGISGLSAACFMAKQGHDVTILEANDSIGGRARAYKENGFMFDMGPSWYWMPDIFERFFNHFGRSATDYYELVKLDPGFRIFLKDGEKIDVPAGEEELYRLFEQIEPGSSGKLREYLADAAYKYHEGMMKLAYTPSISIKEFFQPELLFKMVKLKMFTNARKHIRSYFKDERLVAIMEFPLLFLGAMPEDIPSLYSLMNYSALVQGTWYPMGGMHKLIEGMASLATELGVKIHTSVPVTKLEVKAGKVNGLATKNGIKETEVLVASGDYHQMEALLPLELRNYSEQYWDDRTFAPSCLIFYLGVNKKIANLLHHNLFFDEDINQHARDIYKDPQWPAKPLFYVCCPSKTDDSVAPQGHENLFVLMPVAPGIEDNEETRERYYTMLIDRVERHTGVAFRENVVYKRSYAVKDFVKDYNACKGNAYGLANTLKQTAVLKPKIVNRKVKNMFYAGQLTVPGPGLPPCIISGEIAAKLAMDYSKKNHHEAVV